MALYKCTYHVPIRPTSVVGLNGFRCHGKQITLLRQQRLSPIRIFFIILLPCSCYNFAQNVITFHKFHRNPLSVLAKQKKYQWHGPWWHDTATTGRTRRRPQCNASATVWAAEAKKRCWSYCYGYSEKASAPGRLCPKSLTGVPRTPLRHFSDISVPRPLDFDPPPQIKLSGPASGHTQRKAAINDVKLLPAIAKISVP